MDTQPSNQDSKPISDDQELAKALAGVSQASNDLGLEETAADPTADATTQQVTEESDPPVVAPVATPDPVVAPIDVTPAYSNPEVASVPASSDDLESIKKDALVELRPLVDKLDLAPEEQFDTYLLLLRSTDDKSLIAPAHKAAQGIADETRRAQALLDIIKEIDYFAQNSAQSTV